MCVVPTCFGIKKITDRFKRTIIKLGKKNAPRLGMMPRDRAGATVAARFTQQGFDFDRVRNYSQTMLQASQVLDDKTRQTCTDAIKKIVEMPYGLEERQLRSYELGFVLLNTMGENFLTKLFDNAPAEWKVRAPIRDVPPAGILDKIMPPKDQRVLYFAYGQSVCSFEFRKRMGWQDMDASMFAQQVAPRKAVLAGYKLDFSAPDGERKSFGLPTLVEQTGANVEGVVYLLSPDQLEYLDTEQPGYRRFQANAVVDDKKVTRDPPLALRMEDDRHADGCRRRHAEWRRCETRHDAGELGRD